MEFGISTGNIDDIGYITYAESLGYSRAWITDTQFLRSNCWAVLALAARETRSMRLGTGVAVAGLRLAPMAANGIATINRLAPGRTFIGIGTGNTAMRMLGAPPMRFAEFRDYVRVVRGLIRGEEVAYTYQDRTVPIRMLPGTWNFFDLEHPIPLYVAGNGPLTQALAGELGDGLMTALPRGGSLASIMAHVRRGAERAGRSLERFHVAALVNLMLLEPGETLASPRVVEACGSAIMANVHYLVDWMRETGKAPPPFVLPIWDDYQRFLDGMPAGRRHQLLHESHNSYLRPEEARFVTPEMIRLNCIVGEAAEVIAQLKALERDGLNQITITPPLAGNREVIARFAAQVMRNM
ncbi:MAG: LLM class flavin-dependent oxidoreductase [Candidatus Lambdaproteobacteria bacterium]|nr:LLM class flavin-dependent oxidoreductase [Candidatus Lambdaproteobacteria bacterium]